jgi:hypothetical protein
MCRCPIRKSHSHWEGFCAARCYTTTPHVTIFASVVFQRCLICYSDEVFTVSNVGEKTCHL